jgi:hypothetical protein
MRGIYCGLRRETSFFALAKVLPNLQQLLLGPGKEKVLFDAGHRLPVDYVPHAVGWLQKHLRK